MEVNGRVVIPPTMLNDVEYVISTWIMVENIKESGRAATAPINPECAGHTTLSEGIIEAKEENGRAAISPVLQNEGRAVLV